MNVEESAVHPTSLESRQFVVNVVTNVAVMILNILVGLWYTPYLIRHLGVATYGIVILATSLTLYMSIFNTALDTSVGRFLTIDIRNRAFGVANRTFNTALWTAFGIVVFLLPIVIGLAYLAPALFDVPDAQQTSARWLFAAVLIAYLLVIVRSVFSSSPFAHNRLDLKNLIVGSNTVLRVVLVVAIFGLAAAPTAWQVGVAVLTATSVSLILSIVIWRRLTPQLSIALRQFDRTRVRSIVGMSGSVFVNQIGTLLFLNIDLIVVNIYLGAEAQGRYGSVLQLAILLRTLSAAVATAITPVALRQFARGDMDAMAFMSRKAVKWMGLAIALPAGAIVGLASPLLDVWLGPEFSNLFLLAIVMILHLSISLAVRPLFSIQTALNKVFWPAIVSLFLGGLNLLLAIWWVRYDNIGIGVALAGALILLLKNIVFTPLYGAHIQGLPWSTFIREMIPALVITVLVSLASLWLASLFVVDSLPDLLIVGVALAFLYVVAVYLLFFGKDDRALLHELLPSRGA